MHPLVIISFVFGGLIGIVTCNVLAFIAKPVNLGLGLNTLIGLLVGGAAGLYSLSYNDTYFGNVMIPFGCSLFTIVIVGLYLNHRAR